jgi:hypothetical protein
MEWARLTAELQDLQAEFIGVADSLRVGKRVQAGVCGEWSPRQVVAHMSGWDAEVLRQFDLFAAGNTGEITFDIDEFNVRAVDERSDLDGHAIVDELRDLHAQFAERLARIGQGDRAENPQYREWVEVLIEHYRHHTRQLADWL